MATFVLIPGAGSDAWYWHLVVPELRAAGHDTVAVDLPCDDDTAGLDDYTDAVVDAVGARAMTDELVVVAQSMGGLTAPLVAERVPVRLLVLVAAMVPSPGETGGDWWTNTGQGEAMRAAAEADGTYSVDEFDEAVVFLHDVPTALIEEGNAHLRDQSDTPFAKPWPLDRWPEVPTRFLLCSGDRIFPADFQRRVVRDRLGFEPDEMAGGHLPALARPHDLAKRLLAYWDEVA